MKTIDDNLKELDNQIGELLTDYEGCKEESRRSALMNEIKELTDIREKLKASRETGSNSHLWVSGTISIATILLVMKYEETNVITSKAYNIATRIFRN